MNPFTLSAIHHPLLHSIPRLFSGLKTDNHEHSIICFKVLSPQLVGCFENERKKVSVEAKEPIILNYRVEMRSTQALVSTVELISMALDIIDW